MPAAIPRLGYGTGSVLYLGPAHNKEGEIVQTLVDDVLDTLRAG